MLNYLQTMSTHAAPKPGRPDLAPETARGIFYRVATPAQGLLVAYGLADDNKAALWAGLASGLLTGFLAAWHTRVCR